ncbi:MAG: hypothetical protein R3251_02010, partial [Candidatus Spechtbacterales bacterium]|nr:hypothetical protein [Candidatus Spechtbacterales bacterium]
MVAQRNCCDTDMLEDHDLGCEKNPVDINSIDEKTLTRRVRDFLNKDMPIEKKIEIAKEHGLDIPTYPQTPPDYHYEHGRPYFDPLQVRHASDMEEGEDYFLVSKLRGDQVHGKRITFKGFEYNSEEEKWYMLYDYGHTPPPRGEGKWPFEKISLEAVSLHPIDKPALLSRNGGDLKPYDYSWAHNYLEFALSATDCNCP